GNIARARIEYEKALNSRSEFRGDVAAQGLKTARARLAAFDSGAVQPVIPPAPSRVTSPDSVPTQPVAAPTAVPGPPKGRRVGLVIGNIAYKNAPPLKNPRHDAEVIAQSLRAVGFETVTLLDDGTREKMIGALRAFASDAEKAEWAVVYYSGHGMEVF